jgi:hypothetical protein
VNSSKIRQILSRTARDARDLLLEYEVPADEAARLVEGRLAEETQGK